jgi:vacuolar-type H+-ATPase subunit E/Vma4
MNPSKPPSEELLIEEIIGAAQRRREQILDEARQKADDIRTRAVHEAQRLHEQQLAAAHAHIARLKEQILGAVPLEASRRYEQRVEQLLDTLHQEIREAVEQSAKFDEHQALVAVAVAAIRRMPDSELMLKVSPEYFARRDENLIDKIKAQLGPPPPQLTLVADEGIRTRGVIIEDLSGVHIWDNRLNARLKRLWPALRIKIALQLGLTGNPHEKGAAT